MGNDLEIAEAPKASHPKEIYVRTSTVCPRCCRGFWERGYAWCPRLKEHVPRR